MSVVFENPRIEWSAAGDGIKIVGADESNIFIFYSSISKTEFDDTVAAVGETKKIRIYAGDMAIELVFSNPDMAKRAFYIYNYLQSEIQLFA